ncbi:MAG TPA: hypothetical protein VD994_07975, partial [Prosthecobacter sp.]|nr:hypothetical protein [Prosthecobacter sp.]
MTALIVRALTPAPPRHGAARLLADIQHRLSDLAHPAYDRVSHLVGEGAHAVRQGVDGKFGRFRREVRNLFR